MTTLNYIVEKILKPLAEDHLQINDFGFGDLGEVAVSRTLRYPFLWIVFNGGGYSGKILDYSFSLILADKASEDNSNAIAVQSDMIQIGTDLFSRLSSLEEDAFELVTNANFKPFSERFTDYTSGVVMDISIRAARVFNPCGSPFKSAL